MKEHYCQLCFDGEQGRQVGFKFASSMQYFRRPTEMEYDVSIKLLDTLILKSKFCTEYFFQLLLY